MTAMRRGGQAEQAWERALDAVLGQLEIPLPDALVSEEIDLRKRSIEDRLRRSGMDRQAYLDATGTTEEELAEQFETDARRSVKAGFVLDKLAAAQDLGVDQNELSAYVTEQAYRMGVAPDRLAKELTDRNQLGSVVNDILRSKALMLLADRAEVKDESGRTVDLAALRAEAMAGAAGETADGDQDGAGE
jgi:trigger factor